MELLDNYEIEDNQLEDAENGASTGNIETEGDEPESEMTGEEEENSSRVTLSVPTRLRPRRSMSIFSTKSELVDLTVRQE